MGTEVWFRDPVNYARELVEAGAANLAWNRGVVNKRSIDPVAWAELYWGATPVRQLLVGDQGTAEVGPGRGLDRPIAVYPTWSGTDDLAFLEAMMERNVGQDKDACFDLTVPPDERPVFGQEHRVVVTEIPPVNTGPGRNTIRRLKEMQEEYPDCILMVHGLYSFKFAFGMGFGAADVQPRQPAAHGRIILPAGNEVEYKSVQSRATWVTVMGMKPADLEVPRNRCIYNIKSAIWAGANYASLRSPSHTPSKKPVDTVSPDNQYVPPTGRALSPKAVPQAGDKTLCNMCSLQLDCKQFRADEVCSLTDGNTRSLAEFFQTRDSRTIIDGLGVLVQMSARRLENAAAEEQALGDIDDKVTKMVNQVFTQGVTLAKLVDPSLRGGGVKVNVGVVNGQATAQVTSAGNPNELVGEVVRSLERQGIPRDKITPELVMATIQGMANPENRVRAIESTVIAEEQG